MYAVGVSKRKQTEIKKAGTADVVSVVPLYKRADGEAARKGGKAILSSARCSGVAGGVYAAYSVRNMSRHRGGRRQQFDRTVKRRCAHGSVCGDVGLPGKKGVAVGGRLFNGDIAIVGILRPGAFDGNICQKSDQRSGDASCRDEYDGQNTAARRRRQDSYCRCKHDGVPRVSENIAYRHFAAVFGRYDKGGFFTE